MNELPTIIVLGKNYSTALGVIRALGKCGYPIELYYITAVKGGSAIAASSKYVNHTIEHIGRNDVAIIKEIIETYNEELVKYILLPTDDYTASLIDRYKSKLSSKFIMPYVKGGKDGSITHLMDKSVQSRIAKSYGLETPQSWTVFLPKDGDIEIPPVVFPCFLKPQISAVGTKYEMCRCDDMSQLKDSLYRMRNKRSDRNIFVQQYIDMVDEYSIAGVVIEDNVIMPALIKKVIKGEHAKGVSLVGQLTDFENIKEILNSIIKMVASFKYVGLFDIDIFRSNERTYFGEINFRSSGVLHPVVEAGANLPMILVKALCGENWKAISINTKLGVNFFYEKVAYEDLIMGFISSQQLQKYKEMCCIYMVEDINDNQPIRILTRRVRINNVKRKVKLLFPAWMIQLIRYNQIR